MLAAQCLRRWVLPPTLLPASRGRQISVSAGCRCASRTGGSQGSNTRQKGARASPTAQAVLASPLASGSQGGGKAPLPGEEESSLSLRETLAQLDSTTRYQLAVLAGGTCIMSMSFGTVAPILPLFASQWGDMGATGVGLVLSAGAIAKLCLNNAMGRRADSHGRVPLMVMGGAITALGNICTAFASSIPAVCSCRLACGVGSAANGPASQAYLADVTSKFPKHRGAIMGTLGSIGMLGYGFGPAVGGALAEAWGPGMCFGIVGVAAALCAALEATLPETLNKQKHQQPRPATPGAVAAVGGGSFDGVSAVEVASKGGKQGEEMGISELLQTIPQLRGLLCMDAAVYISWAVWLGVVPLHAVAVWDATPGTLGLMFSVMAVAGGVGAPLGGWLSDRYGRDAVILSGASCCALSTAMLPFATDMVSFGAFLMAWDFSEAVLGAALSALAAECAPDKHRGKVFAARSNIESGVFLVAPIGIGVLADTYSLSSSLGLSTLAMGSAVLAFRILNSHRYGKSGV